MKSSTCERCKSSIIASRGDLNSLEFVVYALILVEQARLKRLMQMEAWIKMRDRDFDE
jgi:hypothetical protein